MPQRTNEFQELVALVQKALVPAGARITESVLVDVPGMSEPREIDVLIETDVGPYRIKIAVEARDQKRKLDSGQFESIVGKYMLEGGVKVNKVVIVTHRGFYDPVVQHAKQLGVELLTLKQAKEEKWARLRPPLQLLRTAPQISNVSVEPLIDKYSLEEVLSDGEVVCSHGQRFGNPSQYASMLLLRHFLQDQQKLLDLDKKAAASEAGVKGNVRADLGHPHVVKLHGAEFPVEAIKFDFHFSKEYLPTKPIEARFHLQYAPHVCTVATKPQIQCDSVKQLMREARVICNCCGKDHGTLGEYSTKIARDYFKEHPELLKDFATKLKESATGQMWCNGSVPLDKRRVVRFLEIDHHVESIEFGVHAISATARAECTTYELQQIDKPDTLLSHFQAIAGGKKVSMLVPHAEDGRPAKIVLKIEGAPTGSDKIAGAED